MKEVMQVYFSIKNELWKQRDIWVLQSIQKLDYKWSISIVTLILYTDCILYDSYKVFIIQGRTKQLNQYNISFVSYAQQLFNSDLIVISPDPDITM